MSQADNDFEQKILVLEQNIRQFRERFKDGTKDPKNFISLSDIERMWCELSDSTEVIYSDIVKEMISEIDEKALIKEKKTSSDEKE